MKFVSALAVALILPSLASAAPLVAWSGETHTTSPVSLPAPGEPDGEWDLHALPWSCVGTLTVAARAEGGDVATWITALAISGEDYSMPAFVRLLYPPVVTHLPPQWAHPSPCGWRIWWELSPGAYGAMYAAHLKVWTPDGQRVRWSAHLDGTCARWP